MEALLFIIVAGSIGIAIWSIVAGEQRRSKGYYDDYGRKLPFDEVNAKADFSAAEVARLEQELADERQHSARVLEKLAELERRLEFLEGKGS
ncbi:MAG: hypothetical protein ACRCYY_06775 [Trueperaceae bacterium]